MAEERKQKEEERKKKGEVIEEEDNNQIKQKKEQLNDIGNLVQQIYLEKEKVDNLGQIAERVQQLLKIKVTEHLIESIKTKINILINFLKINK